MTINDCLFRSTSLTFDPSLIDIFLSIHCGACLCIFSKEIRQNPILISLIFDKSHCTIAQVFIFLIYLFIFLIERILDDTKFFSSNKYTL